MIREMVALTALLVAAAPALAQTATTTTNTTTTASAHRTVLGCAGFRRATAP